MAKHEKQFEGKPLPIGRMAAEHADRFADRPRDDLLIRFLAGEEIEEGLDGTFAPSTRLTRRNDS
ncbi:hypothetical protein WJT74_00530 [Sphingomicrobium sp. XHP0239]|uniref:hypothetical protein n=1 Tax=Sphingomicrobium maritimum TaxID=3133972 RepID=UPI0031CC65EB